MGSDKVEHSPLGKEVGYVSEYSPELLFAIPRNNLWQPRHFQHCPFQGYDIWNAYEMSWLNAKGLPQVAVGEFRVSAQSPNLIESKSFKLYLNSYNQTRFNSWDEVEQRLVQDLSACAGGEVALTLRRVNEESQIQSRFDAESLDELDVEIADYDVKAELLKVNSGSEVCETLSSDLLRSNCPVTGQPDWGSVFIKYKGQPICRESLLKYVVSFREHSGFHEQCVETIFLDLMEKCSPSELTVYARYLRRGGLDINPLRSTSASDIGNIRLVRQ